MTEQQMIDPADLAGTREMGLVGPDYWTYAQVKDWILLCPDMPHVDVRVYGIFRSLATRWLNNQRVTKDRIRFMCPGVNGKPMSERAFDDVLKRLGERGLVVIEKGSVNVRSARNAATGRFERVEELLVRVHELPAEGTDYAGWHTVREAFDAYPGPGWDQDQKAQNSRSRRPQKSADGSDLGNTTDRPQKSATDRDRTDQAKQDVSAGHTGRTRPQKSATAPQISADRPQKSATGEALTSPNPTPHTSSPNGLSTPPPPAPSERPQPEDEEEDVTAFWEAMPGDYRPGRAKRAGVDAEVRRLLRTRTPQALADEVMSAPRPRGGVRLPVRWVLSVLPELPDHPPAGGRPAGEERVGTLPPACPACLASNPAARTNPRWRYRDDGSMCECHPDAARAGHARPQPGAEPAGVASAAG